jgi:alpha-methylacyl-CoA racemase
MSMAEASTHARNAARRAFVEIDGVAQPAPAPRYSATPTHEPTAMTSCETLTAGLMGCVGHSANEVAQMRSTGIVG